MALAPRVLRPPSAAPSAPSFQTLGYTRLWGLTSKAGAVSGTALSDTGQFAVKWWDGTIDTYLNGATFTKSGSGTRAFDVYPAKLVLLDDSGGNRDATSEGNAQLNATDTQSGFGSSVLLDGSGDYLNVGKGSDFQFWGSENWTIEMWIRPSNVGVYAPIFISDSRLNLHIYFNNTLYLNDATTGTGGLIVSNALTANQWQHVAAVRSGSTSSIYVNGIRLGFADVPYGTGEGDVSVGGYSSQNAYMTGRVDEVRVVRGSALYSGASFTPPFAPLTPVSGTALLLHCDSASIAPAGQFDAVDVSGNEITKLRAESVSLSATPGVTAPGQWTGAFTYTNNGYTYWNPGNWIPGTITPPGHEQCNISGNLLNSAALDQLYTDLLSGGGSIYVAGNLGIAGDDPTIATAKGYTVFGSVPPSTLLLLNFNGSLTDSSPSGFAVTAHNGAQVSTARSKFGTASAAFSPSSRVEVSTGGALALGLEDFTIEMWVYFVTGQGNGAEASLFSQGSPVDARGIGLHLYPHDGVPDFLWMAGDGWAIFRYPGGGHFSGGNLISGQWNHVALTRENSTFRLFSNGNLVDSINRVLNLTDPNQIASIGGRANFNQPLTGNIDDLRVIRGKALYTSNFTPPTSQLGVWTP